jgi:hypothetical protein
VVLFSLIGLAVQVFLGVEVAFALGILAGFIVANFVPSNTACSIGTGKDGQEHTGS